MVPSAWFYLALLATLVTGEPLGEYKIVGGSVANSEFPFMAHLVMEKLGSCGGAVIGTKWIITAAHCIYRDTLSRGTSSDLIVPDDITVSLGSLEMKGKIQVKVQKVYPHPKYDSVLFKDDLALLELNDELKFGQNLSRIPIDINKIIPNQPVIAAGWGQTESSLSSPQLLQVPLRTAPKQLCRKDRPRFQSHNGPQICTGRTPGRDTCPGDSGGPLVTGERGIPMTLLGITSFGTYTSAQGFHCGNDTLGYYTHVAHYLDFIRATTKLNDSQLLAPAIYVNENSNARSQPIYWYFVVLWFCIII
ncbi:hypothetical protein K7432_015268 [Basidiobolus ranarum]|uniref:Peptidase S1 domain-containing protein n=1 Tax=Basidiobolus ranarum TaxID=34480 RepID=A0ABR2WGI1_9FUNG